MDQDHTNEPATPASPFPESDSELELEPGYEVAGGLVVPGSQLDRVQQLLGTDEPPADHIRNALQIIAGVIDYAGTILQPFTPELIEQTIIRLQAAAIHGAIVTAAQYEVVAAISLLRTLPNSTLDLSNTEGPELQRDVLQAIRFVLNAALHLQGTPAAPDPAELVKLGVLEGAGTAIGRAGAVGDVGNVGELGTNAGAELEPASGAAGQVKGDALEGAPASEVSAETAPIPEPAAPRPITEGTGLCHCPECEAIRAHNAKNAGAPSPIGGQE